MINLKHKKLYRSPKDAILLGIAAGIGHYFEVDPVFVRLAWLVAGVLGHIWVPLAVYAALFFVMPIDPAQDSVPQHQAPKDVTPTEHTRPEPVERMDENQNM